MDFAGLAGMVPACYSLITYADFLCQHGEAWAGEHEGEILCLGGAYKLERWIAEGWAFITQNARRYPLWLTRTFKREACGVAKRLGVHRLQIMTDPSNKRDDAWAEALGFQKEGICRAYTQDRRDLMRWSMII